MTVLRALTAGDTIDSLFKGFDMFFFNFFGGIQNGVLTPIMKCLTLFGDARLVIAVIAVGIIMCLFKKTRKIGLCIFIALIFSTVITNGILKPTVMRYRPYITLQDNLSFMKYYIGAGAFKESDYSFPSGHTTAAFSYCTAIYLSLKNKYKNIAWVFPAVAVCVMISRIYLMVHYASDVLFAMLIGIACAAFAYKIAEKICRTRLGRISIGRAAGKSI